MSDYIIRPITGREAIQRNFVTLPQNAPKYSGRHISLNERFSIIERGYYLQNTESTDDCCNPSARLFAKTSLPSREELKNNLIVEMEKRREKQQKQVEREAAKARKD